MPDDRARAFDRIAGGVMPCENPQVRSIHCSEGAAVGQGQSPLRRSRGLAGSVTAAESAAGGSMRWRDGPLRGQKKSQAVAQAIMSGLRLLK